MSGRTERELGPKAIQDGRSLSTAIDLTGNDEAVGVIAIPTHPLPQRKTQRKFKHLLLRQQARIKPMPDVKELKSHRDLTWWKDKYYEEYSIHHEYLAAMEFPLDIATIKTVVPNRYLQAAGRPRKPKHSRDHKPRQEFPGRVEIQHGVYAIKRAYAEHTQVLDPTRLVLWTDGSHNGRGCGMAIVYRQALTAHGGWTPWTAFGFKSMGQEVGSHDMESIAILKAFDIASKRVKEMHGCLKDVAIYTDSSGVLIQLRNSTPIPLIQLIIKRAKALMSLGVQLTVVWCPGHSKVGYERSPYEEIANRIGARK